jgi:uncharacterized protein
MRILSTLILCFISFGCFSQVAYTVETVPNTKLVNGSYVSDPDKILSDDAVGQINATLKALEDSTTAQVAVVILGSIGENDIFEFAEKLFNNWHLGQAQNDNGLLILFVQGQKTIRFHTGDGMEAILPDARCKQIQRDYMVPKFKEGDVNAGMIEGVAAVARVIEDPTFTEEVVSTTSTDKFTYTEFMTAYFLFYGILFLATWFFKANNYRFADSEGRAKDSYPQQSLKRSTWLIVYGLIPSIIVILFSFSGFNDDVFFAFFTLYFYFIGALIARLIRLQSVINGLLKKQQFYKATELVKSTQWYWFLIGLVFPIPFFIYFFIHLYRKRYYRNYPRTCCQCTAKMKRLSEKDDDEFLSDSKRMEEELKSGNYDVWLCLSCKATEEYFYKNPWSVYEKCPKCKTLAFYKESSRTIRSASYSSSGEGENTNVCQFCKFTNVTTYSIAKLERSTSSSSSFSSSSSSSSSGGSWGGGSSSGGGASSSW